jgi:hypothetical protein
MLRERRINVYEIEVDVKKLEMWRRQYANEVWKRGNEGFDYVGGDCVVKKRIEKVKRVEIIEEKGGL